MRSRRTTGIRWCAALLALFSAACGAGERAASEPVVRDSAGIVIVENTAAAWSDGQGWRLSAEPVVDIGEIDGAPEYRLFRAWDAARLPDGRIVVANGGTSELRFYDAAGRFRFAAGRQGGGPGEFEDLQTIWLLEGDSLLAYDFRSSRLSIFDTRGQFVRSFALESPDGRPPYPRGPLGDGSLVVTGGRIFDRTGARSGIMRGSVPYFRYSMEGVLLDTIGRFPASEVFRLVEGDDFRLTSPPFAVIPARSVAHGRLYFGPADRYEIQVYSPDGALERLIRLARANRPVTAEDIERFREERLERGREEQSQWTRRLLAAMQFPETMPGYSYDLEVDAAGNLWVRDYQWPEDQPPRWTLFDAEGRLLGTVEVPPRFEVYQIGTDFVLGRWTDALDVEHIRMYELIKATG